MLTGIPEVELGVETKIKNIEAIELANLENQKTVYKSIEKEIEKHPYLADRFQKNL